MIIFSLFSLAMIVFVACVLTFVGVFWFVIADIAVFCLILYGLCKLLKQ